MYNLEEESRFVFNERGKINSEFLFLKLLIPDLVNDLTF